jgi:hypothetical protein
MAPLLGQIHCPSSETYSGQCRRCATATRGCRVDYSAIQIKIHNQSEQVIGPIDTITQENHRFIVHLAGDGN